MKLDTTFSDFHKGQGKLDLELPSSEDLEIIENGNQQHDKIMRSTEREPSAQTRQAARNIAQAIKVGSIDEAKLDQLAQVGLLEPAAVDLYRAENTSPVDEKFAATIAKDWKRSTAAEDTEVLATRYKRAYHVGIEAQQKGMIDGGKMALDEYVDVLVNLPEQVFASTKRLVTMTKSAGGIRTAPMVGHTKTDSEGMERTASASGQSMDATNWKDLANVLWGDKLLK